MCQNPVFDKWKMLVAIPIMLFELETWGGIKKMEKRNTSKWKHLKEVSFFLISSTWQFQEDFAKT